MPSGMASRVLAAVLLLAKAIWLRLRAVSPPGLTFQSESRKTRIVWYRVGSTSSGLGFALRQETRRPHRPARQEAAESAALSSRGSRMRCCTCVAWARPGPRGSSRARVRAGAALPAPTRGAARQGRRPGCFPPGWRPGRSPMARVAPAAEETPAV